MKRQLKAEKMKKIELKAYGKINLSIDVLGKRDDGYHEVDMIMQQIDLWDLLVISTDMDEGPIKLTVEWPDQKNNKQGLPDDKNNLAQKAAELMGAIYKNKSRGCGSEGAVVPSVSILLKKNIPIAAGLGGGSADAAAVIHGLNYLWGLDLNLSELMKIGGRLGSDIPFCIMGQAALNPRLGMRCAGAACGRGRGRGTVIEPLPSIEAWILLVKPDIFVSTAEIYGGLVLSHIRKRPDNNCIAVGLEQGNISEIAACMDNVLESVSINKYPIISQVKALVAENGYAHKVMMSGSGPTVFGIYDSYDHGISAYQKLKVMYPETYLVRSL